MKKMVRRSQYARMICPAMSFALVLLAIPVQADAIPAGDLDRSMADPDRGVRLDPKTGNGFNGGGLVHIAGPDFDPDPAGYDRAISLDPKNPMLYRARGYMYRWTGHL